MPNVEKKIRINATPEQVYKVLMDFPAYPDWNPMVIKIEGDPAPSSTITAHIQIGSGKPQTFTPLVLKNEPNKEFRWVGKFIMHLIFRGEHYFVIEPEAEGGCTFIHGENFSGVLASIILGTMGDDLPKAFEAFNTALKEKVEKGVATSTSSNKQALSDAKCDISVFRAAFRIKVLIVT
ncbi:Polyketide cyclase/dehydrase [Gracilaria domingensis]|nr:Polyketide cyclase/dehydrase [Gracilaria domingensis]